jgi:DNA-binding NarL/FixJ family response regulator
MLCEVQKQEERRRMCILLADDNPEVRSALRLLLEQEPTPVIVKEVSDAKGLFLHLEDNCPRAVLLDWELPGSDKHEILVALRAHCPAMKVIALSSRFEARQEALTAGVDAFISKAEPPELILSTLCSLVPISQSK